MIDYATLRDDVDILFSPSDEGEVAAPPVILPGPEYPLPIPVEPLALGGFGYFWWRRRRAAKAAVREG